ncbi:hypothetical protein CCUS01_12570 [Colletotrichum cuscutae]|uniref:Uncharacterized protein n=1 Tax=Colletotrichum cuscutae TaxID=1209917 RepID=A0AAI9TVM4_9PEZI|nr:hypothetical protein CCUS01_12570 [Colletotrichum cuscutae]
MREGGRGGRRRRSGEGGVVHPPRRGEASGENVVAWSFDFGPSAIDATNEPLNVVWGGVECKGESKHARAADMEETWADWGGGGRPCQVRKDWREKARERWQQQQQSTQKAKGRWERTPKVKLRGDREKFSVARAFSSFLKERDGAATAKLKGRT